MLAYERCVPRYVLDDSGRPSSAFAAEITARRLAPSTQRLRSLSYRMVASSGISCFTSALLSSCRAFRPGENSTTSCTPICSADTAAAGSSFSGAIAFAASYTGSEPSGS